MAYLNWAAVLIAAIVYFFFGALWFMALFGKPWAKAAGLNMDTPPGGASMAGKLAKSFLGNLLSAIAVALLVYYAHGTGAWMRAAKIGAVAGFGIAGGSFWTSYSWTSKPFMLWLLDTGYYTIGCAIAGAIIGAMG